MGIINLTPDSFYDGGKLPSTREVLAQAETMLNQGASFLDIGGYSSQPDANEVSEEEELKRVVSAVESIATTFPEAILSIDTFRSKVASEAIQAGAAIVNDISAGHLDEDMFAIIASHQVPYIMMHMKGSPQTMKQHAHYKNITQEVLYYFSERIDKAREMGINDLIVDPGFGFAKTVEHNFRLLQDLALFKALNTPILIGISRKSMIYKTLKIDAQNALNGTTALHSLAIAKGAKILRTHDVKEAMEVIELLKMLPLEEPMNEKFY
ncbi:MAG: dihydropteroate synthase [Flavobacteriaceae bacterium]|nr:dihydropteroate synthase [Flavobacteriaceae bacterium]